MAYSKAYQQVVAGRVREDEALPFFRENKVATPARITSFNVTGAKKQPVLAKDVLQHEGIGKTGSESENISAYNEDSYNLS